MKQHVIFSPNIRPIKATLLNVKYAFEHYFLTHIVFTLPYSVYAVVTGDISSTFSQMLAYACLVIWFAFGLYKTRQPKFVATIAVLFILSQYMYFAEHHTADVILTLICVLLMCIKQYTDWYRFAVIYYFNKLNK
jgi:hypothetical protein